MLRSACPAGPKIALHLVGFFFCMPTRITCTIIMSCTLFPCNFIFNLMAALSTGVATTSSTLSGVEQLRV